ncbi:hypothetical protein D3C86_1333970 [compost metagenome]
MVADLRGGGGLEALHVDGGRHHLGGAAVVLLDAARDLAGVGDEAIDAIGGEHVPLAQVAEQRRGDGAQERIDRGLVRVVQVPGVAHGGVGVADVDRFGAGHDALGAGVSARQHQVVAGQVELLEGERHQGQELLVVLGGTGQALEEGRAHVQPAELGRQQVPAVDGREDGGVREHAVEGPDHALGATEGGEPFMNQGDLQRFFL